MKLFLGTNVLLDVLESRVQDSATLLALVIQKGLSLGWHNFEDAVQAVCALEIEADYFVSRNPQDFSALSIPVVIPSDVLQYLKL